jgi:hypothetical protein
MELFIFIAPVTMGVGLWLILRQKPREQDDDDASKPS